MAKVKLAGAKKKKKKSNLDAVPCLVLVIGGIMLLSLLFYAILRSANP